MLNNCCFGKRAGRVLSLTVPLSLCWIILVPLLYKSYSLPSQLSDTVLLTESRTFLIQWTTAYTNTGDHPVSGSVHTAVIPTLDDGQSHCQRVLEQTFAPLPDAYVDKGAGRRCAVFRCDNLAPGQSFKTVQTVKVRIGNLSRLLDSGCVHSISRGRPVLRSQLDRRLAAVNSRILLPDSGAWDAAVRQYDYVRSLNYQLNDHPKSLEEILRHGTVQCQDAARLLAALIRQSGCRARQASGIYLRPEMPEAREMHAWSEMHLPGYGWIPLDPTMGRFAEARSSRLAQLDNYYLTLWLDSDTDNISAWYGAPGKFRTVFRHRQLGCQIADLSSAACSYRTNLYLAALEKFAARENPDNNSGGSGDTARIPPGWIEMCRLSDYYRGSKQLPSFWRLLIRKLHYRCEREDLLSALSVCADSADWQTVRRLASFSLKLYPGDADFNMALAHAEFRLGHIPQAVNALETVYSQCPDGYAEAMLGSMYLDAYQIPEARRHWQTALRQGLRADEAAYCRQMLKVTGERAGCRF